MITDNFCFYLQNRLIQTSQTGGQWYSDTSPLVFLKYMDRQIERGRSDIAQNHSVSAKPISSIAMSTSTDTLSNVGHAIIMY